MTNRYRIHIVMAFIAVFISLACLWSVGVNAEGTERDCVIKLSHSTVGVGETITATWSISGGNESDQVVCDWRILEADGFATAHEVPAHDGKSSFIPTSGVRGYFVVNIFDSAYGDYPFWSDEFTITGAPEPLACAITLDKGSVATGQPVKAAWTITGGESPYSVECDWYLTESNGNTEWFTEDETGGQASFVPSVGIKGKFLITVTDANNNSRSFDSTEFTITGAPEPLACAVTLDKDSVAAGQPIKASWTITGGKAPYSLRCSWCITESNGNTEWFEEDETGGQASFVPSIGVKGQFKMSVTDANGISKWFESAEFTITGAPDPLDCSITLDKDAVVAGQPIKASWTITGGKTPYSLTCSWYLTESNGNTERFEEDETGGQASFVPSIGVKGQFEMSVTDANGIRKWFQSAEFTITGGLEPLACTIKFDKSVVNVNEEIAADVQITGGVEPYFIMYSWRIIEADGNEISYGGLWVGSFWVPRLGNRGYLYVIVKDDVGREKIFSSEQFEILGAPLIDAFVCSAVLDKQTIHVGETITAEWYASGGTPPYQFNYEWLILEQNGNETRIAEEYMQTTRASCTPKFGMEGTFRLTAMDALGREVVCEPNQFSITGAEETASITCTMKIDKTMIKPFYLSSWRADDSFPDETVSVTWNVDGGEAPYTYDLFCVSQYHGAINKTCPVLEVDPVAQEGSHMLLAGNLETEGYFKLTVTDAKGRVKEFKSETFYVDWSNPAGGPGDTNTTGGIDILDLVSIIDFIVSDKAPKSFTNTDANGDGTVDILDLVWIIDWIVGV